MSQGRSFKLPLVWKYAKAASRWSDKYPFVGHVFGTNDFGNHSELIKNTTVYNCGQVCWRM